MDGRSPRDVPSPSALRWRGSLAATHPLASAASPPVPRPPSLPESTESDNRDAFFTEQRDFTDLTATSSSATSLSPSRNARSGSIAIEPNTVTVSDVSNADTNADTDDDAAYREVLAAAAAAVREAVDAVRVAAVPRKIKHEKKKFSAFDEDGEDFDESVFAFRRSETDELRERFRFVPGVGATTSRRAAAAAVAKTAMDLVSSNERAGREKGAAIRF